jgi:hypothetical protein
MVINGAQLKMRKEVAMIYLKILSQHLLRTEENYVKPQSEFW